MGVASGFQPSLLDVSASVSVGSLGASVTREELTDGAWVDLRPGWVSGADALFERLRDAVPWQAERRPMYDRVVDVPRLLHWVGDGDPLPDPVLVEAREVLNSHYADEPFVTAGMCLYRDGRDSVAWHGDRVGRGATHDTMVAILVLGSPRPLLLRPTGGGGRGDAGRDGAVRDGVDRPGAGRGGAGRGDAGLTRRYEPGHGDLLVMGGSCQRTWEHAVPKSARPTGPRMSIQFRPRGVR